MSLIDIQKLVIEREKKYFDEIDRYAQMIKSFFKEKLGQNTRVYIFGSVARKDYIVGKSDIDVMILSNNIPKSISERSALISEFAKSIGDLAAPFEFHFANDEIFRDWYLKFVKNDIVEV